MKKIIYLMVLAFMVPFKTFAQLSDSSNAGPFGDLLRNILIFVNDVLIPFIIGIGFLVFIWGIFLYFIMGGADEEKKIKGRSLVVHATLGFVAIIIFFGVLNLITSSIGLEGEALKNIPEVYVP